MTDTDLTIAEVFGPDGLIANGLEGYETRAEQVEMADAVASAMDDSEHLLVETGTAGDQGEKSPAAVPKALQ